MNSVVIRTGASQDGNCYSNQSFPCLFKNYITCDFHNNYI